MKPSTPATVRSQTRVEGTGRFHGATAPACRQHVAKLFLELGDLVSQAGGELEVQLRGSASHLLGELLDELGQLLRGPCDARPRRGCRRLAARALLARHLGEGALRVRLLTRKH